jgi:predicted nucleic-acid-binding Zn-ribbon protein
MTKEQFEQEFVCPKCHGHGAFVQEVSLGRGVARVLPLAPSRYLAVSCGLCGYTEFYQMAILEKETEEAPALIPLIDKPKP